MTAELQGAPRVRIDAHHHLWDPARAEYPWMVGEKAALRRRCGPEQLAPELAEAGIQRTVVVQARSEVEETEELLRLAGAVPFIAGVVGWVDLTSPEIPATLRRLRALPEARWLVGVRHQVEDEPDPNWLRRADVRRGLHAVAEAGLVYDLLVLPPQIPAAVAVAQELTELRFVVDHLAKQRLAA
ncbi:MAG: amidohydrolase family protein, partial [Candidatus Dormiibacterota bacterium]